MGVFAAEPLKVGTLLWVFDPIIDQEITKGELAALPEAVRDIALSRSFISDNGKLILARDNGVFLNHSDQPNMSGGLKGSYAVRDIAEDEELTEDYHQLPAGACRDFLNE
jgi:uncharacterized protein